MQRNVSVLSEKPYDLLVIGGGIVGISIARDAALRGLSVALVDKSDFADATTAASSKLIHGGLRYLQNLELGLVRESLRERRVWSNTAPHMVHPLMFLMPLYDKGIRGRIKMALGLTAYDWLAYDRNRLDDPEKAIPAHHTLTREEAIELEPGLDAPDLTGATIFYDYQMHFPERLALACLRSAVEAGADAANYVEACELIVEDGKVVGARMRDNHAYRPDFQVRANLTINAAGPWADRLLESVHSGTSQRRLIRSKGIHILTRPLTQGHAVAALTPKGHFFILPWRGYSLIGTTDTVYRGDPDGFRVTEKDITEFVASINEAYPAARLERSDVLFFYGGLRPIVEQSTAANSEAADEEDAYNASRASEIVDHEAENGLTGILTAIGGKWTTARHLAEQVVDMALVKLGATPALCATATTPVFGGNTGVFTEFLEKARERYQELPEDIVHHLAFNYGAAMEEVLRLAEENPALYARLDENAPDIGAEIVYAVRSEMALTLDDVLFRRTGIGSLGRPNDSILEHIQSLMAAELEWSPEEIGRQHECLMVRYVPSSRIRAVVNPRSSGSHTSQRWPEIAEKLKQRIGPFDTVFTDGPMAAMRLTAAALRDGVDHIVAVGGDGTVNEVVNGFFEQDRPINPKAVLSIITSATGGDFRKTLRSPEDMDSQIARVAEGEAHAIDLGLLTYRDDATGDARTRYFDNVASFGLSGATDRAVNQLTFAKSFGGKFAFFWGMLKALLNYRGARVRLRVDEHFDEVIDINTVAVCNGKFFGGGMQIAPLAAPDDGLFDIIVVRQTSLIRLLIEFSSVYRGSHLEKKDQVFMLRGRKVTAEPVSSADEVLLDVDGEAPGRLPATFEIVPHAILLKY
ncbi:MAG TPA: FAD-dependent oxidoreductase [Candidatus Hydrogenedentes bacterium]|nr:FAD-dependent oxidoreductase [Candidatus Hydrogenedentota bacterium]